VTETTAAPGLLLPAEVAEQLRTGRNYVYRRIADGTLKHINIGTPERPKFRIRPEDLAAFVESLQGTPAE
jgi:excisionase family DNA binding protein